ncbi:MAG TPA: universal stress protein [Baekduia sp.]|nr:universal stress protein [Baekduia sp.]
MTGPVVVGAADAGDAARDAVALGARLARALDADLIIAGIWPTPFGPADGRAEQEVRRQLEADLGTLVTRAGVPASIRVRGASSVVRGLHQVVDHVAAGVLVLGASHLGRLGRLTRGDVAMLAVQALPCAVAVAPAGLRDREPADDVLVGWDATPEATAALELAATLAAGTGGTLRIAHALEPAAVLAARQWVGAPAPDVLRRTLEDEARAGLAAAEASVAGRTAVRTELLDGVAGPALREAAVTAGLLVVGSRRFGVLGRLVLGSTSAELLHEPPVSLVVLPRTARS